jgi:hypothetical protein
MRIISFSLLGFVLLLLVSCGASTKPEPESKGVTTQYQYLAVRINQSSSGTEVTAGNPDGSLRRVSLTPGIDFVRSVPQLFTQLGSEGWELVVFEPIGPSGYSDPLGFYLFKRAM